MSIVLNGTTGITTPDLDSSDLTVTKAGTPIIADRTGSNGTILDLKKDGSTVGIIGTTSGGTYVGTGDTGIFFEPATNQIRPFNTSTANSIDATIDLGRTATRFKDLYLSGGVYLGGTGSANLLDSYEEGTFTPDYHGSGTYGTTTFSSRRGSYTKIGNQVTVQIQMSVTATTASSYAVITGLPFSNNGTHNSVGAVLVQRYNFSSSTGWVTFYLAGGSANDLRLYLSRDDGTWLRQSVDGNFDIYMTVTYTAA